ncbi:unnamed protein product [Mytilus edulis]|uniref:Uncharacterized protein n=1 Tax=Mytilus edulis TaxID=6550 RepID=A0A8S3VSU1_MYTED|nr:unnamed protein product [Mytilus edulis]
MLNSDALLSSNKVILVEQNAEPSGDLKHCKQWRTWKVSNSAQTTNSTNTSSFLGCSDSTFHESTTAVNEHLQTESAETTGMTGEDKVAVKVITLMLPALEVLITTKQDDRLNKHDEAINKLQAQVRNVLYENDSLNQYSRRENVRISNVPEADGEDLTNILIEIAGSVGVVIKPDNINAIHNWSEARGESTPSHC